MNAIFHGSRVSWKNQANSRKVFRKTPIGLVTSFLIDLLDHNVTKRILRSDTQGQLPISWYNLSQMCNSSIRYAESKLWNDLPQNINVRDAKL